VYKKQDAPKMPPGPQPNKTVYGEIVGPKGCLGLQGQIALMA